MSSTVNTHRGRWQIVILALVFFGPAILAWVLVISGWRPGATTNHGVLVEPPVRQAAEGWRTRSGETLDDAWFTGHWSWVVPVSGGCTEACTEMLDELRRARIALNQDADRVSVVLLQPRGADRLPAPDRFPALVEVTAPAKVLEGLLEDTPDDGTAGRGLFIVDYLGFRMMTYPMPLDSKGLLEDTEQLLEIAKEEVEDYQQLEKAGAVSR
ncbi:hypothetical protein [Arhodomonas sp. SL1]|uniref:hypothetical protein n=1 Tax=Arhodomonas sp. SL1 TaxID=3425691 RepID=UPI003F885C03